jgi:putative ABC transport system permease protein
VGIRKVLGGSEASIVSLLAGDFLKLVLIAFGVAAPVAWFFMNKWLEGFAYRTGIPAWVFLSSGTLALLVASLTVVFQSLKAALANPVQSLRAE